MSIFTILHRIFYNTYYLREQINNLFNQIQVPNPCLPNLPNTEIASLKRNAVFLRAIENDK